MKNGYFAIFQTHEKSIVFHDYFDIAALFETCSILDAYQFVYWSSLDYLALGDDEKSQTEVLEAIFRVCNDDNRPLRQIMRSLSVSDIVVLNDFNSGETTAYYCGTAGWVDISAKFIAETSPLLLVESAENAMRNELRYRRSLCDCYRQALVEQKKNESFRYVLIGVADREIGVMGYDTFEEAQDQMHKEMVEYGEVNPAVFDGSKTEDDDDDSDFTDDDDFGFTDETAWVNRRADFDWRIIDTKKGEPF